MSRRSVTGKELLAALKRNGFDVHRVTDSHYILVGPEGQQVAVPHHTKDLRPGTLSSTLKQAQRTLEELGL